MASGLEALEAEIHVFTSGSTKTPRRHVKTWRMLAGGAALTDILLRRMGLGPGSGAVIGTTPHQHMYGLEATVFAAMAYGYAAYSPSVFYPADLETAVGRANEIGLGSLALITSPAHLRYLEDVLA